MNHNDVKKILEKQLQLLSQYSERDLSVSQICDISNASAQIAALLLKCGWWGDDNYVSPNRR